jgi:hypothetical protein
MLTARTSRLSPVPVLHSDDVSPALYRLCQALHAKLQGNERELRLEGRFSGGPVLVGFAQAGSAALAMSIRFPRPLSFRLRCGLDLQKPPLGLTGVRPDHPLLSGVWLWADLPDIVARATKESMAVKALAQLCVADKLEIEAGSKGVEARGEISAVDENPILEIVKWLAGLAGVLGRHSDLARRQGRAIRPRRFSLQVWALLLPILVTAALAWRSCRAESVAAAPVFIPGWRALVRDDGNAGVMQWVARHRQEYAATVRAKLDGQDPQSGQADILVSDDSPNTYRVMVQVHGKRLFDRTYDSFAFLLKVPAAHLNQYRWIGEKPRAAPDREALLIVSRESDVSSGEVIVFDGSSLRSYRPEDYRQY